MISILIPLAPGTKPHPDTLASITRQSVPCEVVTRSLPYRVRASQRMLRKRTNEVDNRNALMPEASRPYAAMMNHDVVLTSDHDLMDCVEFLRAHTEWDAVALNSKRGQDIAKAEKRGHVVNACIVFRTESMTGFVWKVDEKHCSCWKLNEKKIRYLDDRQLREAE